MQKPLQGLIQRPNDPSSKLRLALAYKENGNYTDAIKTLKESAPLVESPDIKAEIYAEIAECYISLGNYTAATNCVLYATKRYSSKHLDMLPAKIKYYNGYQKEAVKELLGVYNNGKNPYAGSMLKEIYENPRTNKQIKSMITESLAN